MSTVEYRKQTRGQKRILEREDLNEPYRANPARSTDRGSDLNNDSFNTPLHPHPSPSEPLGEEQPSSTQGNSQPVYEPWADMFASFDFWADFDSSEFPMFPVPESEDEAPEQRHLGPEISTMHWQHGCAQNISRQTLLNTCTNQEVC